MKKSSVAAARNFLLGSVLMTAAPIIAAQGVGAVVESQPSIPGQTVAATQPVASNDALSLLLDQNRQLQAEVQALRGMVEEQGFELRKLQRDSLNRYTDMDERLRSLETNAASMPATSSTASTAVTGVTTPATSAAAPASTDSMPTIGGLRSNSATDSTATDPIASTPGTTTPRNNRVTSRGTLQPAVLSEQQLYQMAYDSVINSNFERSIAEFDQYLSIYPQGRFVTNAHYWKGQAYLYLNRYDEARDSYEIILNQYQDSAKLPDAMYGLGLAYQGLGNIPQARQLLNEIKRRFPNTGVANLADTRLLTLD